MQALQTEFQLAKLQAGDMLKKSRISLLATRIEPHRLMRQLKRRLFIRPTLNWTIVI